MSDRGSNSSLDKAKPETASASIAGGKPIDGKTVERLSSSAEAAKTRRLENKANKSMDQALADFKKAQDQREGKK
jgi:hypothetical protein